MPIDNPDSQRPSAWRDEPRPLEGPAFLGRPFPGTRESSSAGPSHGLRWLIGVFALVLIATIIIFDEGNTVGGLIALGILITIGAAGFFVLRSEIRRVMKGGRS